MLTVLGTYDRCADPAGVGLGGDAVDGAMGAGWAGVSVASAGDPARWTPSCVACPLDDVLTRSAVAAATASPTASGLELLRNELIRTMFARWL